jgi:asparagine synthase (glutamine-hydrolysing)
MCGIAGIFNYREQERCVDHDLLVRMTRALRHRGPDDEGFFEDGPVGLGHRRLSIIDLTANGHQPMSNLSESCWIVYNGEFYNHLRFRARLESQGHRFRGASDTETLLHLLERDGAAALAEVAGIFTLAFWDTRKRRLLLARDPLGVKQLYYYDDGSRILFASEIKALLVCPELPRMPNAQAINEYLHFHTALFDRTFFQHIRQVRAGEYLDIGHCGRRASTYWSIDQFSTRSGNAVCELRDIMQEIVGDQLMSDVPTGSFFSGGIDSSAVASFAARGGHPLPLFGVHFSGQGVIDERPYQDAAARALGLDLELTTLDGSTFPQDLMRLMYYQDQPVLGPAMFPMDRVSRLAAQKVKVCLGGQGADEIFGGYARYSLPRPWQTLWNMLIRRGRSRGGSDRDGRVGGNLWKQALEPRNLRRLARNVVHLGDWRARYFEHFAKVPEATWAGLFGDSGVVSRVTARETFDQTIDRSPAVDPVDRVMHWDVQTYLTGLFHQDDRMSMMWSLESRVPFADPRLVRFAFATGPDLKLRDGATKWILRRAVADVLPEMVLNRRKVGFDTPAESWMRDKHNDFLHDLLLSSAARQRGLWNPRGISALLENSEHRLWFDVLWKVVCIEAWAKLFLDQEQPRASLAPTATAQ